MKIFVFKVLKMLKTHLKIIVTRTLKYVLMFLCKIIYFSKDDMRQIFLGTRLIHNETDLNFK